MTFKLVSKKDKCRSLALKEKNKNELKDCFSFLFLVSFSFFFLTWPIFQCLFNFSEMQIFFKDCGNSSAMLVLCSLLWNYNVQKPVAPRSSVEFNVLVLFSRERILSWPQLETTVLLYCTMTVGCSFLDNSMLLSCKTSCGHTVTSMDNLVWEMELTDAILHPISRIFHSESSSPWATCAWCM